MKFVVRPRASGKTTKAVEWVKADERRVLIVHSAEEAKRIEHDFDVPSHQLWSVEQVRRGGLHGRHTTEVGIENVDLMFYSWLRVQPDFVTATGELA